MADHLIVTDAVAPIAEGDAAVVAAGLARALAVAKHRVTVISTGPAEQVARIPGMARRLRTVEARIADASFELALFEGRPAGTEAQIYVLGDAPSDRGRTSGVLASAVRALAADGLLRPEVAIGVGEVSASGLAASTAPSRLFVLPTGSLGPPLSDRERAALGVGQALDALSLGSLGALGVASANAVVVPSPSSLRQLERHPGLSARASDEPFVAVRLGCDDPPHDPATDPALPAPYGPDALGGKAECRRAVARRTSLGVGPRTLMLGVPPLAPERGGRVVVESLARLVHLDVAVAVAGGGDRALTDQANVLAIEHPGRIAVLRETGPATERQLLAGLDAWLLADAGDLTGRAAGLALRYGALPIAPEAGACGDYLVDHDPASESGVAILYGQLTAYDVEAAVRRAVALRADAERWRRLERAALLSAPRWAQTVALIAGLTDPVEARVLVKAAG